MECPVLKVSHVYKRIGRESILKNITLSIQKGEIIGLIGPNGSGKTTLIRTIAGLIKMNKGDVEICGKNIHTHFKAAIQEVGAIIENPEFYPYLTGYQNLKLWANMDKGIDQERMDEMISLVQLQDSIHDKVSTYSLGMKQRLGIAQALLHRPKLLLLDEPTNGLDPSGIIELRHHLKRLSEKEGVAILISSHFLHEIETICHKTAIIKDGEIIGSQNLERRTQGEKQDVIFEINDINKAVLLLTNEVNKLGSIEIKTIEGTGMVIRLTKEQIPVILKILVENEILVYEVKAVRTSLEDAFLSATGGPA